MAEGKLEQIGDAILKHQRTGSRAEKPHVVVFFGNGQAAHCLLVEVFLTRSLELTLHHIFGSLQSPLRITHTERKDRWSRIEGFSFYSLSNGHQWLLLSIADFDLTSRLPGCLPVFS